MSDKKTCIYYKPKETSRCTNQYMCPHKYKDGMKKLQCDVCGLIQSDKIKAKDKPGFVAKW